MSIKRKWPKIDLVHFVANNTYKQWNKYLTRCEYQENVTSLVATYYGLQIGMQDAVRRKLNTPQIIEVFIRLQRSIEKTLRRMYKKKHNKIYMDPLSAEPTKNAILKKKAQDYEFEKWLTLQRH